MDNAAGDARSSERQDNTCKFTKCTCGIAILIFGGLSVAALVLSIYPTKLPWYSDLNQHISILEERIEQLESTTGGDENVANMIADLYDEIRTNFSTVREDLLGRIDTYPAPDIITNQSMSCIHCAALFSRVDQLENQTLVEVRRFTHNLQVYEDHVNGSLQDLELSGNETRRLVEGGQLVILQSQHDFEVYVNESLLEINTSSSANLQMSRRNAAGLENLSEDQHSFSVSVNNSLLQLNSSVAETRNLVETNRDNLQLIHQNFTDQLTSTGNEMRRYINSSLAGFREQVDIEFSDVREQLLQVRQFTNVGLLNVSYTLDALGTEIRTNVESAIDDVRNRDIAQLQNRFNTDINILEGKANSSVTRLMQYTDESKEDLRRYINDKLSSGTNILRSSEVLINLVVIIAIATFGF